MKILLIIFIALFPQFLHAFERFIPLELFTGGKIRNDTEIKFSKTNLVFGEKKKKKIEGPENWDHPNLSLIHI